MKEENQILIEQLHGIDNWSDLKVRLEQYNTSQTETTSKKTIAGKIFEVFAKAFFAVEPEQNQLYKEVWLYDDIPLTIKEKLNLPQRDFGIDLLLQDKHNRFVAVQCKFKNNEQSKLNWSKDKIGNTFGLAEKCDFVIVFTNASNIHSVAQTREKFKFIGYSDLLNLTPSDFNDLRHYFHTNSKPTFKKLTPLPHQEKAISSVIGHFKNNDRGQLILPCGAGKTLTALWVNEKMNSNNTLVLFPSLALLRQFKTEWSRNRSNDFDYICICSEKDIDKNKEDTTVTHTYEISGEVTTNPDRLVTFLSSKNQKIVFSTYQSIEVTTKALKKKKSFIFDLIICDEAHRTAGNRTNNLFTLIHNNNKIRGHKRLYMTATPKVVSNKLKTRLGEDYELLCDMSNPEVFGNEAYRMTFGKAIDKKILVDYKIIGIGVTHKQVKEFIDKRKYVTNNYSIDEVAHNYSLDIVMENYNAFHSITFHHRVKLAKEFSERHNSFFPNNQVYSKYVEGKQPTSYRASVLNEFKNHPKGIVSNARCLTEGVDVPTIDLIYFCDPKTSKIDIVQASGRALRKDWHGTKKMGYIVVPIFHYKDDDIESEIEKKPYFQNLISVIRSLCDQDERLQAEIDNVAFEKGKKSSKRIEITYNDEEIEKIIKLDGLEKRVREFLFEQIIEKTRNNWNVRFQQMKEYILKHGNSTISKKDLEYRDLFYWAGNLRRYYYIGTLAKEKIRRLNEIGFEWKGENRREINDLDEIWWASYEKLIDYYKEFGDSDIPARHKKDKSLGTWVVAQRASRRKDKLAQGRIDLLDELDFSWDPKVKIFDQFCERLIEFKEKYGHTEVPIIGDEFPKLGRWTNKYRVILNNGVLNSNGSVTHNGSTLTKLQIEKLNELGFKKAVRKVHWADYYNELKEYYIKTGHSRPSQSDSSNLYYWCYKTRKQQDQLTKDQRKLLEDLEFDFSFEYKYSRSGSNQNWTERFSELQLFFEENQHFEITPDNEAFEGLYKWLVFQRRQFNNDNFATEKIAMLRSIGFNFDIHFQPRGDVDWEIRYNELKAYYSKNKSFFIPTNDKESKGLLSWLRYQRKLYRDEKLDEEKKIKLLELGYSFNRTYRGTSRKSNLKHENIWNEKFEHLKIYHSKYNTFLIQRSNDEYKHLIPWLQYQKNLFRNNKLEEERISKLSSIGFSFDIDYRGKKFQFEVNPEYRNQKEYFAIDKQWQINFELLKDYFSEFETFLITGTKSELLPLKSWLQYQKQLFKKGKLHQIKINRLETIGFSFDFDYRGKKHKNDTFADDNWLELFEELKFYHSEYNTFLIPKQLSQYNHLKVWLQEQKRLYKASRLSEYKLDLLSQIGYSFELNYRGKKFKYETNPDLKEKKSTKGPKPDSWERNYLKLIDYKIQKGNCNVPRSHEDKSLASFVSRQRYSFRRNTLPKSQIQKLELLDFEWEVARTSKSGAWADKFSLLKNFFNTSGHSVYKKSDGDLSLYHWVLFQRMEKRKEKLSEERIKALDSIDFIWDASARSTGSNPDDDRWLIMLEKLEKFKKENGHCLVPQIYKEDKSLGRWVNDQRSNYNSGRLSNYRKEILNELGFVWDKKEFEWSQKLELLNQYYQQNGHFNIKQNEKGYKGLYYWIYKIRKEGTTEEKKQRLKEIGYEFVEYRPENWFEFFSKVAKLKDSTGNIIFKDIPENAEIIKWIEDQKILIARSELPKDKFEILNAIGLPTVSKHKPRKTKNTLGWFEMLNQLKDYYDKIGDFNVPKKYPKNQALSSWLYYQKTLKRTNKLGAEKIIGLKKIGFEFPIPMSNQKTWVERYEELLNYKEKYGDCKVPVRFKENQQLATWVRTQRRNFKEKTINIEKKGKLDQIGFIWRVTE